MSRKYSSDQCARWIVETARGRLERERLVPASGRLSALDRLAELDPVARQGLGVRLGEYIWSQRAVVGDPESVAARAVRIQSFDESLGVQQRAFLTALLALLEALALGDGPVAPPYDPSRITGLAARYVRGRLDGESVVTPGLARGIVEPLLAGDRSAFRNLVGAVGGALVTLDSAALDGTVEDLLERGLYWELKSLLWLLNGVLGASRQRAGARTREVELSA